MTDLADETLLRRFEECTLPFEQWTHRSHVRVAYLYLTRYPFEQALTHMRSGIQAYNAANDVPEDADRGYHETMTRAWMRLIDLIIREYGPAADADHFYDAHPELSTKQILRFFYTPERFMSAEAKAGFVEPDLTSLPTSRRLAPSPRER